MNVSIRLQIISFALVVATGAAAQSAADGPIVVARTLEPTASVKIFNPAGSVRLVAWDKDSIVVRGRVARQKDFFFGGNPRGVKFGMQDRSLADTGQAVAFVVYMPRRGMVSIKTVSADISATDISGWFYTVSGTIRLQGTVTSAEAESLGGNIDMDVAAPWIRAKTGDGHLLLRGSPQDVDASTIGGDLDVAASTILRGRIASVTGDIHYAAAPAAGSLFEVSSHSGSVDLLLPRNTSGRFDLSSVTGTIANGFAELRPVSSGPHNMRLNIGRGDAQFTVRTFKGVIRLRPRS